MVENSGAGGISILTPGASDGNLFFGNESENATARIIREATTGDLKFLFQSGVGVFRFQQNGNMGIGTSTPIGLLQVGTNPSIADLIVKGGGNVGIGTTSPGQKLSVIGDAYFSGNVGIGGGPDASRALFIQPASTLTGTTQYGIMNRPIFSTAATANGVALEVLPYINAGSFTMTNMYGILINDADKQGGSGTITNNIGLYIENHTVGSASNYAIYSVGGTNYFGGNVGIGVTAPSTILSIKGNGTAHALKFHDSTGASSERPGIITPDALTVSTDDVLIAQSVDAGLILVRGVSGGNVFADLVMASHNSQVTVINSQTGGGSPAARTYSMNSGTAHLYLKMASGTYTVKVMAFVIF